MLCVPKKSGALRLIFDTRIANLQFKDPPSTRLPSAAAFAALDAREGESLFMASGDIECAFYRFGLDPDLGDMFSFPPIQAQWLGFDESDGVSLHPRDVVCHALRSSRWDGHGRCTFASW